MQKQSNVLNAASWIVGLVGLVTFLVSTSASYALLTRPLEAPTVATAAQSGPFNPDARLDTSQVDDLRALPTDPAGDTDAEAEGRDVLTLDYGPAPADLWNALRDHPGWYDDQGTDGYGRFIVPVGAVIDVPGGLYIATLDGWFTCTDWSTFGGECSATGPVVPVDSTVQGDVQDDDVQAEQDADRYGAGGGAVCGSDAQCRAYDHDHGITEHDGLPCDPRDPHDAARCAETSTVQI